MPFMIRGGKMPDSRHVFEVLDKPEIIASVPSTVVVFGADSFLKQHAIESILERSGCDRSSVKKIEGELAAWRDIHDALATRSLFDDDGKRVSVVKDADSFVSKNRTPLEKWSERSSEKGSEDATLLLELNSFPGNTKLYKLVLKQGLIVDCNPPLKPRAKTNLDETAIQKWIIKWGKGHHAVQLTTQQANILVERVGAVFGLLDCELAKLALFADAQQHVSDAHVKEMVGGWRTKTAWEIADSIAEGRIHHAMEQIDRLMISGQNAIGLSAQLSWSFRRFGLAAHVVEQQERYGGKVALNRALEQAGFRVYEVDDAARRLRRIGRARAKLILPWLKDLDMKLKGSHSVEDRSRFALEEFVMRMG